MLLQIFGYGNHVWPRARVSAGLYASVIFSEASSPLSLCRLVVSSWVKSLGLEFKRNHLLQLDVAEAPRILFARPTCYLPANRFNTLSRLMNQYSLTSKELVLVYPDETVLVRLSSSTDSLPALI